MSLFSSLRKNHNHEEAAGEPRHCDHLQLAPRWANAADMGKSDCVTEYACTACGATFNPDEVPDKASV